MRRREFLQAVAGTLACAQAPADAIAAASPIEGASRPMWAAYARLARPRGWTYVSGSGPVPTIEALSRSLGPVYALRASAS